MRYYNCVVTPRLNAPERAPGYNFPELTKTTPLGKIPEVAHTYAYIDSDYAVMNEHGLMFGECTNNSLWLENRPVKAGEGLFYSSELARVALERCRTAREAVDLMGKLVDTYGLYGTGETLLVADQNEGWVFEMQPIPTGIGGLWIAQRVPDGEIFVAANQFRIRDISAQNPDQVFNPALPDKLKDLGWAAYDKTTGQIDWVKSLKAKEDFHPYFALRRVWRAMSLLAPSLQLPAKVEGYETRAYPFAVKPDKPLTLDTLIAIHRDAYEGTEFDMTKAPSAGSFACPYRYKSISNERSIASAITGYTWISQVNSALPAPLAWISLNTARENPFIPLAVAPMPQGYEQVDKNTYDPTKPWWTYSQVAALSVGYDSSITPEVQQAAKRLETEGQSLVLASKNQTNTQFAETLRKNAAHSEAQWKELYGKLLVKCSQHNKLDYAAGHVPPSEAQQAY